jgi:hypothetical protein
MGLTSVALWRLYGQAPLNEISVCTGGILLFQEWGGMYSVYWDWHLLVALRWSQAPRRLFAMIPGGPSCIVGGWQWTEGERRTRCTSTVQCYA